MKAWHVAVLISLAIAFPFASAPASAAVVNRTLVAFNVAWHDGSETGASPPAFTVTAGDTLSLRIENHDGFNHTFTLPHWNVYVNLTAGNSSVPYVRYENLTTSSSDVGSWQFYCNIPGHSLGTYPNRTGMVGTISVTAAPPALNKTLVAFNTAWHDGSETGASPPTFTVAPGTTLSLRIENHDGFNHTFTLPHWNVYVNLTAGSPTAPYVAYVNLTTSSADAGSWQFYCDIPGHSTGTYPNRTGMVGTIKVATTPPPKTPGFEALAAIGAVAVAFVVVAVRRQRRSA